MVQAFNTYTFKISSFGSFILARKELWISMRILNAVPGMHSYGQLPGKNRTRAKPQKPNSTLFEFTVVLLSTQRSLIYAWNKPTPTRDDKRQGLGKPMSHSLLAFCKVEICILLLSNHEVSLQREMKSTKHFSPTDL